MNLVVAVLAGIIPMLMYAAILYQLDRYEKEPLHLIAAAFLWGFIPAAILSLISQLVLGFPLLFLDESGQIANTVTSILIAPITEEVFKGLALLLVYLIWRQEFDGVFDGIVYGGLVGFGFAAIENVLYFLEADGFLIVLRTVIFGLNHAFFTALTGIGFGIARHTRHPLLRYAAPLLGLLAAIGMHMLHNLAVGFAGDVPVLLCLALLADWGGVVFILIVIALAQRREREWVATELRDEVALGTLSAVQYTLVCSPVRRATSRLGALLAGDWQAYRQMGQAFHALTRLAYKKHAHRRRGERGASSALIETLRKQAQASSAGWTITA